MNARHKAVRPYGPPSKGQYDSIQLSLLRRQTRSSEIYTLFSSLFALSLVVLAYFQWKTSETVARLEENRATPRFTVIVDRRQKSSIGPGRPTSFHILAPDDANGIRDVIVAVRYFHIDLNANGIDQSCWVYVNHLYQEDTASPLSFTAVPLEQRFGALYDKSKSNFAYMFWSLVIEFTYIDVRGDTRRANIVVDRSSAPHTMVEFEKSEEEKGLVEYLAVRRARDRSIALTRSRWIGQGFAPLSYNHTCGSAIADLGKAVGLPYLPPSDPRMH
jgi:hypothetical protein